MKRAFHGFYWGVFFACLFLQAKGQYAISNGYSVPARDTLRVLIVFAEVDYSQGPCPGGYTDYFSNGWPRNAAGKALVPASADDFFDAEIIGKPQGYITGYYHDASFGSYVMLGDYLPDVLTIPCHKIRSSDNGLNLVLSMLDTLGKDTTLYSKNGYALREFDRWTMTEAGLPKLKKPDGSIDLLYIIWRNNRFLSGYFTGNAAGYGVSRTSGLKFKNMKGVNNVTSYNNADGDAHGYYITIAEHLHGIFGGNNWHSGGGRGIHTFLSAPHNYGCTAQLTSTMFAPSAWDRWMMDWKPAGKNYLVSAWDSAGNEVDLEKFSIETHPQGGTFYLRNHHSTGDAVRIKLPHIDWQKEGDVKNQYLWLENRQLESRFDQYYYEYESCTDNDNGRYPHGTPGIYAYIQVGKDIKSGTQDIYRMQNAHPNALASWIFPVTAEGNYDFNYRYDRVSMGFPGCGSWNNRSIPIDRDGSLGNPFTGCNDLYDFMDFNKDGSLITGDSIQPGLSDMLGDSVWFNYHMSGDWEDPFCKATGNTELSLSTNPAPVPVYTYTVDYEFSRYYFKKNAPSSSYENRKIWLNGLKIEVLDENAMINGEKAIQVRIRWNDYTVRKNVRWCGDIMLSPNDFDTAQASLILQKGKKILLDRSLSPTYHLGWKEEGDEEWFFSDTTVLHLLPGSIFILEKGAVLELDHKSKLIAEAGSEIRMEKGSKIIIRNGASLEIRDNALLTRGRRTKIIYR